MAVTIDRDNGKNYAKNIISPVLNFDIGNWTISSGVGTATKFKNVVFSGENSLRLENNAPSNNLIVSNSNQDTIVDNTGNYQLSWFCLKDDSLESINGKVYIYKNAALLDTQSFTLGNTDADLDVNQRWQRFQSDTEYPFLADDVITFQLEITGSVTSKGSVVLWYDGFMLNKSNRGNVIAPFYQLPYLTPVNVATGYQSRFQATTQSLTSSIDNLITIVGTTESNGDLTLLDANGKVTPVLENDVVSVDFAFTAITPTGTDNYLTIKYIANSVSYRSLTVLLVKGSGIDDEISFSANLPVGSDFINNGLEIFINPSSGLDIKDKYISVTRTHIAK